MTQLNLPHVETAVEYARRKVITPAFLEWTKKLFKAFEGYDGPEYSGGP